MVNYDFRLIEQDVLKNWESEKQRIHDSLQFPEVNAKLFSWVEGPPTANAPPAIHHIEVRVYKDIFLRFKAMQGYSVARKGGWDCHGLPVEVQVEKKLKLADKKAVVEYGVDRFIDECKSDVFRFIKDWNESTKRLGFWVDLDSAYKTLDVNYMESVWWSLKEIFKKGLLYKGHKVVPLCPRCETPLSSHEVAQGYKIVEERSLTVQVKLKDEDAWLLVWTTTPWTLPSNNSIAVNPDIDYVFVEDNCEFKGKVFVLAKELLKKYFPDHKLIRTVKGRELADRKYEPIFPYYPNLKNAYKVLLADYVNTQEGTGIVHQASAYGELDYEVNKAAGIDFFHTVDKQGRFTDEVKDFAGMFVKDADPLIIEWLRKQGKLFVDYDYKHDYPFCWRCDSPLIYYATESWFIAVSRIRDKLVKLNSEISWYPEYIKQGRFGNWIAEAKDWALSRNKFWGTPLPVWVCSICEHLEAVGSIAELEEKGKIEGKPVKIDDLHIMSVDPVELECPLCKGVMKRTPEVIDCWYDSGSATFAQWHYPFENKDKFDKAFPYDFIVEAVDQTRGWFYTLHVLAAILFDKPAYRSCAVAGIMCDEKGDKMSKSKGNVILPNDIFDKYGVDATRLAMASYSLGNQIKFGHSLFEESIMPFFNTFWNLFSYVKPIILSAEQGSDKRTDNESNKRTDNELDKVSDSISASEDKWLIAKCHQFVIELTLSLEKHEYNAALGRIISFVDEDFSKWYIKLVRDRSGEKDVAATLNYCFEKLLRAIAPFIPYTADYMYRELYKKPVHFSHWPDEEAPDKLLISRMDTARELVTGILAARDKAGVGVRWPLSECVIQPAGDTNDDKNNVEETVALLGDLIKRHTNLKSLVVRDFKVEYDLKPNYRNLGKEFLQETADVISALASNKADVIRALSIGQDKVQVSKWTILPEHVNLIKIVPVEFEGVETKNANIYLLKSADSNLESEGFSREVARRVQQMRKEANLNKDDRIDLVIATDYKALDEEWLKQKVGASKLQIVKSMQDKPGKSFRIKDISFEIMIKAI